MKNLRCRGTFGGLGLLGIGMLLGLLGCDGKSASTPAAPSSDSTTSAMKTTNHAVPASAAAEGEIWMNDFELAKSQAKINQKPILLVFSGSDWCGWCIKLEKEVLSQPEFTAWAKDHLILMNADFPRTKPQSDAVKQQNEMLSAQYHVNGFPTVLLLDAEGRELARTGYQAGGAANYVNHLQRLLQQN